MYPSIRDSRRNQSDINEVDGRVPRNIRRRGRIIFHFATRPRSGTKPLEITSNRSNPPLDMEHIRNAKSASDWTRNDFGSYKIELVPCNAAEFFQVGQSTLPLTVPDNNPQLLKHPTTDDVTDKEAYRVLEYMDLAMARVPDEESAVDDFTVHLLLALGYAEMNSGRIVRTRKDIPLYISGEWRHAETDVCVIDKNQNSIVLVVQASQEDKRYMEGDPIPQLVAKAISAFQHNNNIRQQSGLPPLNNKVMPGIAMIGTSPIFFKVDVTTALISAIEHGDVSLMMLLQTIVEMHVPEIPRPPSRFSEGMRLLENRSVILACFEAFKQFLTWLA